MSEIPKGSPDRGRIRKAVRNIPDASLASLPRTAAGFTIEQPATDHLVSLSTFKNICDTPFAKYYIDSGDIDTLTHMSNPSRKGKTAETTETQKIKKVKDKIDNVIYAKIQEEFCLESPKEARSYFQSKWQQGIAAIEQHAQIVYGQPASISDELKREQTPSRLIQLLVSNYTAPELQEQIKTNLLLTRIAGEIELSAKGADKKLRQLQDLFNEKLYEGKIGETEKVTKYGLFTSNNDLVGSPQDTRPTDMETPKGTHYKTISANTRTVKLHDNMTQVVQIANTKSMSTGIEKALRKTLNASDKDQGDIVKSSKYVQDTHRMMFVLFGDNDDAEALRQKVGTTIIDNYGYFETRTPEDILITDAAKNEQAGKSAEYERLRIQLAFKDIKKPIEIIIQTLPQYLRGHFNVGTYDAKTDTVSGPNHAIMENVRARTINEVLLSFQPPTEMNPKPAGSRMRRAQTQVQRRMAEAKQQREITIG